MILHHNQSCMKITRYNMHNLLLYAIYHGLLTIGFLATKYTNDKLANESFKNDFRLA